MMMIIMPPLKGNNMLVRLNDMHIESIIIPIGVDCSGTKRRWQTINAWHSGKAWQVTPITSSYEVLSNRLSAA